MKYGEFTLPDEIKVFDTVYKIFYFEKVLDSNCIYSRGIIHYIAGTMSISLKDPSGKDRAYSLIWRTIWHEVMHIIRDAVSRDLFPTDPETICNLIATVINSVCFDNNLNFQQRGLP